MSLAIRTVSSTFCCSDTKFCPTLGDPTDCRMPGSSVLHYVLKFAQIHLSPLSRWSYLTIQYIGYVKTYSNELIHTDKVFIGSA